MRTTTKSTRRAGRLASLRFCCPKCANPEPTVPIADTVGPARPGAPRCQAPRFTTIRLPGYVISAEVVFGCRIRVDDPHDAGSGAHP
jgi:hypothetical protein